jgi:hypothetical protein
MLACSMGVPHLGVHQNTAIGAATSIVVFLSMSMSLCGSRQFYPPIKKIFIKNVSPLG